MWCTICLQQAQYKNELRFGPWLIRSEKRGHGGRRLLGVARKQSGSWVLTRGLGPHADGQARSFGLQSPHRVIFDAWYLDCLIRKSKSDGRELYGSFQ